MRGVQGGARDVLVAPWWQDADGFWHPGKLLMVDEVRMPVEDPLQLELFM